MAHLHDAATPSDRLQVFYLLYAPDKLQMIPSVLMAHRGREELMYRKLEEKYGAWRFFEVWSALDAFYRAYCPPKLPGVPRLMRDWHPRGLEALLISLENRYSSRYFTDRELVPLNDGSKHRIAIEALYRRYDPTKVGCIGAMMGAYRGHESELLKLLKLKYEGAESLPQPVAVSLPSTSVVLHHPAHPGGAGGGRVHSPYTSPIRQRGVAPSQERMSPRPPPLVDLHLALPAVPASRVADATPVDAGVPHGVVHEECVEHSHGWVPPTREDWEALVAALKRKDSLIAKQTAAIQEQSGSIQEQRARTGDALAMVPRLVHQGSAQREALHQLSTALSCREAELLQGQPQQQARDAPSPCPPGDAELSKQVDLTALARILDLNVPKEFLTHDSSPPVHQPHDSIQRLRTEALETAQRNMQHWAPQPHVEAPAAAALLPEPLPLPVHPNPPPAATLQVPACGAGGVQAPPPSSGTLPLESPLPPAPPPAVYRALAGHEDL